MRKIINDSSIPLEYIFLPGTQMVRAFSWQYDLLRAKQLRAHMRGVHEWTRRTRYSTRTRTRWIWSRARHTRNRVVVCYGNAVGEPCCLTVCWPFTVAQRDEGERQKAGTLQKQGRRRSQTELHARPVLHTAHQESSSEQSRSVLNPLTGMDLLVSALSHSNKLHRWNHKCFFFFCREILANVWRSVLLHGDDQEPHLA